MTTVPFDANRALLKRPDMFQRFRVTAEGVPLKDTDLSSSTELLVFERHGERRALLVQEMAYHHVAQGELAGEPYIVSFCNVCNTGVGMAPVVNGNVHHFSAGGLYNGLVLLIDDETRSYWDHITGRAVYGPLQGAQLETWSVTMTNATGALEDDPSITVLRSRKRSIVGWFMGRIRRLTGTKGFLPPFFRRTMAEVDKRLARMTLGLGVVVEGEARFYPTTAIGGGVTDDWNGRVLHVSVGPIDRVPVATWEDGARPFQLFSRWYGFVLTFPSCRVYNCARPDELAERRSAVG